MSSESVVQQQVRLAAARAGLLMYRNNSGAYQDESGRLIRYGLANESAQLNKVIKSGDLVGITPIQAYCTIGGVADWRTLGVFTNIECKPSGWTLRPSDERGLAQEKFNAIVREAGGFAGFATCVEDITRIIGR